MDAEDTEGFKDADLMLFDKVIAFDNFRQKIILIVNISLDNYSAEYNRALMELENMASLIMHGAPKEYIPGIMKSDFTPLFTREEYCEMVNKAKHHIKEGDIFQVVLSNPMRAKAEGSLFDTYRVLRATNPSPYMFYFSSDDIEIAGASPETLVKLEAGNLSTFPLAGTRPRGKTAEEDEALRRELLADEKERAEHVMLVDLARNDMGRISEFGTVKVTDFMNVRNYSHVMHIVSMVEGRKKGSYHPFDLLASFLPAGTLSGAPKIRAMEIIEELEKVRRGLYGGATGYVDFSGDMDFCITIRTMIKKGREVYLQAGAGIVADSVPGKEYQECCNKVMALARTLLEEENL